MTSRKQPSRSNKARRPRPPRRLPVPPAEILRALTEAYGQTEWHPRYDPLDELIFTVLTQHTSDSNALVAFMQLRKTYPTWPELMAAPTSGVAEAIRSGGLANIKAARIQDILSAIMRRRGNLELAFLGDLPLQEAKQWLRDLPGVGPKTAAVVLSFALGMPAMPVDTHIYRVSRRLGLITQKTSVDDAHDILEGLVAAEDVFRFHVLLITHGRRTCRAQRPLCGSCVLRAWCPARPAFEQAGSR